MNSLQLEGSDWGCKGLTGAARAKKELAVSKVAEGGMVWGLVCQTHAGSF